MDEGWDENPVMDYAVGVKSNEGSAFSKGRGFAISEEKNTDPFNNEAWGDNGDSNWGGNNDGASNQDRGGNYRGGQSSYNSYNNAESDADGSSHRGRGRGRCRGRGGGRGRGGRDNAGYSNGGGGDYDDQNDDGSNEKREQQKPKDIYVPEHLADDELFNTGISSGINFCKYEDISINITGEDYPQGINTFEEAGLRPIVLENIKRSGYNKPTPIQKHSIPIIAKGRDLMSCAQTGSGKTAAFLLPIINKLMSDKPLVIEGDHVEPQALIISPTRELAIQIFEQARKFALRSFLKIVVVYGGTSVNYQLSQIMKGCHILVATPGRLRDFVEKGNVSFSSVECVILDEADRMLDMGFMPVVEELLTHPTMVKTGDRQTLMFSATFPEEIQHLAGKFLHNYIFVTVGIVGGACSDVEQIFFEVDKYQKRTKLIEILNEQGPDKRTLVFVETKRTADFLASFLSENNMPTTSIHGDRLQREREKALYDFKTGSKPILIATGVAARGLDIKNVHHVINFDLPSSIDEYVHRIGRTGRVGNSGKATSFYEAEVNGPIASALARILQQAGQEIPAWLGSASMAGDFNKFGGTDVRGDNFGAQNYDQNPVEEIEEEW